MRIFIWRLYLLVSYLIFTTKYHAMANRQLRSRGFWEDLQSIIDEATHSPSELQSNQPSTLPSTSPSIRPTSQPSSLPSSKPSLQPSSLPSSKPSLQPSAKPSIGPSLQPSMAPSRNPSSHPSIYPTRIPSSTPSTVPTMTPSLHPSNFPTLNPSQSPTVIPSTYPSMRPSMQPSVLPSMKPSVFPSIIPSLVPTIMPSLTPSLTPSLKPSTGPSTIPSLVPTREPSLMPSTRPSLTPSESLSVTPSLSPSTDKKRFGVSSTLNLGHAETMMDDQNISTFKMVAVSFISKCITDVSPKLEVTNLSITNLSQLLHDKELEVNFVTTGETSKLRLGEARLAIIKCFKTRAHEIDMTFKNSLNINRSESPWGKIIGSRLNIILVCVGASMVVLMLFAFVWSCLRRRNEARNSQPGMTEEYISKEPAVIKENEPFTEDQSVEDHKTSLDDQSGDYIDISSNTYVSTITGVTFGTDNNRDDCDGVANCLLFNDDGIENNQTMHSSNQMCGVIEEVFDC